MENEKESRNGTRRGYIRAGDIVTLENPNGDRIGPRALIEQRGPGNSSWLSVERTSHYDTRSALAEYSTPLVRLQKGGWSITSITSPQQQ